MTYFNRKLMNRDIPASATVEGALVIPVICCCGSNVFVAVNFNKDACK